MRAPARWESALPRGLWALAALLVVVGAAASFAWALATLGTRPLDGVEGDVLFEADRLRAGRALYTDPAAGVLDYGQPPARYLVLYPPLWAALLTLVAPESAAVAARAIAMTAWVGLLVWLVVQSDARRRRATAFVALFVGGAFVLVLYGAAGRPDALAACFSGLAVARASRRAERGERFPVDAVAGALFALAVWTKPNVLGAAPGAFIAATLVMRRRHGLATAARGLGLGALGALLVTVVVAATLSSVSHGQWVDHLLGSTLQPPSTRLFVELLASRGPFFGLLLVAALVMGWRVKDRDDGAFVASAALATSLAWMLTSLAKIGSATNYFLEPCVTAIVVVSRVDLPDVTRLERPSLRVLVAALAVAQTAWVTTASLRSARDEIPRSRARAAAIEDARDVCKAPPLSTVMADEPGLERMMNGRILGTPFQTTHRVLAGRFPVDAWVADVERREVQCLVMQDDLLERPLEAVSLEHDRFPREVRAALKRRFALVGERAGYWFYRARSDAE